MKIIYDTSFNKISYTDYEQTTSEIWMESDKN